MSWGSVRRRRWRKDLARSTAEVWRESRDLRVVRIWEVGGGVVAEVGTGEEWRHLRGVVVVVGERRRRGV